MTKEYIEKYKFVDKNNSNVIKSADEFDLENESEFRKYVAYNKNTPDEIIKILESARKRKARIRIFLGDVETGICWHEMYDIMGTVGLSTGPIQIPLLINKKNSYGGGAILDHCIVQITEDRIVTYKNPKFAIDLKSKKTKDEDYPYEVYDAVSGKNVINVKTDKAAENMIAFFSGKTNRICYK